MFVEMCLVDRGGSKEVCILLPVAKTGLRSLGPLSTALFVFCFIACCDFALNGSREKDLDKSR